MIKNFNSTSKLKVYTYIYSKKALPFSLIDRENAYIIRVTDAGLEDDTCSSMPHYFLSYLNFSIGGPESR